MVFAKRYVCQDYVDGTVECYRDGFWFSKEGYIIKWSILAGIFFFFMAWFVGGYLHAKRRMRKGLPLKRYHRWLVPYSERRRYGQVPQNHFTFYNNQPYAQQQRADGTWPEPPPMYNSQDAPPGYGPPPPGASKTHPTQTYVEMQPQATGGPQYQQQTGVVGGNGQGNAELPSRPANAVTRAKDILARFRK